MSEPESVEVRGYRRAIIALLLGGALFGFLWWSAGHGSHEALEEAEEGATERHDPDSGPLADANAGDRPRVQIPLDGRLTTTRKSLQQGQKGDSLLLGLELPDAAHGGEPLSLQVIDVQGRALELEARPVPGEGNGISVEIDPAWLQPSQYLIQVATREDHPLPLRRYVLVIVSPEERP